MLGYEDEDLEFTVRDDEAVVSITFPSMSRLRSVCGPGCDWAYVLQITGASPNGGGTTTTTAETTTTTTIATNGVEPMVAGNLAAFLSVMNMFK